MSEQGDQVRYHGDVDGGPFHIRNGKVSKEKQEGRVSGSAKSRAELSKDGSSLGVGKVESRAVDTISEELVRPLRRGSNHRRRL